MPDPDADEPGLADTCRELLQVAARDLAAILRRLLAEVALAMALWLLAASAGVICITIGIIHLGRGLHGLLRLALGAAWAADLLTAAVLLALPVIALLLMRARAAPAAGALRP